MTQPGAGVPAQQLRRPQPKPKPMDESFRRESTIFAVALARTQSG